MWQKDTADVDGDGMISAADQLFTGWLRGGIWGDPAKTYVDNLNFAGHEDWRLPKFEELVTLVDLTRREPRIDPAFSTESWTYQSSSEGNSEPFIFCWYVVRFDFQENGTVRDRVWSVNGTERTLMLDVNHKKLEPKN